MSSIPKLFQQIQVGNTTLSHRIVHAPLTRFRANADHVVGDHHALYYSQRASEPGTLLISEATVIAAQAGGYTNVPGIYTDEQIKAWKKVTDAVHAKGSFVFVQLWALGRTAKLDFLAERGFPYISASDIGLEERDGTPRPLTTLEIKEYVQLFATAAFDAVNKAGFDGIEVHGANGYLIDQFLQDVSNKRTDEYGGSVENRIRFPLEVIDAIAKAIGPKKTAIRLSPWSNHQGMKMENPRPTFGAFVSHLRDSHPDLAYIHVVESRLDSATTWDELPAGESIDFLREIWSPKPFISNGSYNRNFGLEVAERKGDLIAYGRPFLANPDLPYRLKEDIPLTVGDRSTYYVFGSTDPKGYTDYAFADKAVPVEVKA